jgi:hypothetical protein
MSRSQVFDNLARLIRIAHYCQKKGITTEQGLEPALSGGRVVSRRQLTGDIGKLTAAAASRALAVEPAHHRQLYLLQAGPVHFHRRK